MDLFDLLIVQLWTGVLQLAFALLITAISFFRYKFVTKTLKIYWLIVFGYLILLALLLSVNDNMGVSFIFFAWIIAFYWFICVFKWLRFEK